MLEYFSPATQIGLTAIPKETAFGSNIEYFGEPIYNYSLKQGMLGHDIYSELLFLAWSTKMMENDVKNLSTWGRFSVTHFCLQK